MRFTENKNCTQGKDRFIKAWLVQEGLVEAGVAERAPSLLRSSVQPACSQMMRVRSELSVVIRRLAENIFAAGIPNDLRAGEEHVYTRQACSSHSIIFGQKM